ncbi:hypothetical protein LINPERHAP1_LOCUS9511 [Linum perenne]
MRLTPFQVPTNHA